MIFLFKMTDRRTPHLFYLIPCLQSFKNPML